MKTNPSLLGRSLGWLKSQTTLLCLIFLLIGGLFFPDGQFWNPTNIGNILRLSGILGVIAIGETFVIINGGLDLSIGGTYALAGVVAAYLNDTNVVLMIVVPLALGAAMGLINGLLVARLNVIPFIATVSTMLIYRGAAFLSTPNSLSIMIDNEAFLSIGKGMLFDIIPALFLILAVVWAISWVFFNHTKLGRSMYATGGNSEAARMVGVNIKKSKLLSYVICGLLAALAGVMLASRSKSGIPTTGQTIHLDAIAAVVLGGTLLSGGYGSVSGTVLGAIIMRIIGNMINMQGTLTYYAVNFITGALVLAVVIIQTWVEKVKMDRFKVLNE